MVWNVLTSKPTCAALVPEIQTQLPTAYLTSLLPSQGGTSNFTEVHLDSPKKERVYAVFIKSTWSWNPFFQGPPINIQEYMFHRTQFEKNEARLAPWFAPGLKDCDLGT